MKDKFENNKCFKIVAVLTKYTFTSIVGSILLNTQSSMAGTNVSNTPSYKYNGDAIGYTVDAVSLSLAPNNGTTCTTTLTKNFNISLPTGATVKEAYLYWATDLTVGDSQITLNGTTIDATKSWNDTLTFSGQSMTYNGYRASVKSIVSNSGTYSFGGLNSRPTTVFGGSCLAGATLIVVYDTSLSDANAVNRIEIFDGFAGIRGAGGATGGTNSSITLPLNLKEADLTLMTALSWQGNSISESSLYTDQLTANGTAISNTNNPANDQGNGSGANKAPNSSYAVDADTFDISFVQGSSSLTLTNTSVANDYKIVQGFVFASRGSDVSDAPITYQLASHHIAPSIGAPNLTLGSIVDGEVVDTTFAGSVNADFDDNNDPIDDEDGVSSFPSLDTSTSSYSLTTKINNTSGSAANVYAWLDFDLDGEFDADERATVSNGSITLDSNGKVPTGSNGTVTLTWKNIGSTGANIISGNSYARIRLTTDNLNPAASSTTRDPASVGNASNGEVEDYAIAIAPALDYGDAPDTYGTDKTASNSSNTSDPVGASHIITSGLFLGATVPDADTNGFVDGVDDNKDATDDDAPIGTGTGNGDDEDNFTLPTLTEGNTSYTIPASNLKATNTTTGAATLHAWIDFNNNGKFDPTEYASAAVNPGTNNTSPAGNLTWSGISVGATGNTYARFRLTSDSSINNSTPGGAANSGEVEDYQIAIAAPVFNISGTVFEDINYGGGAGRNFNTAETSATSSGLPISGGTNRTGVNNARVELYSYDGVNTNTSKFIQAVNTDTDGKYSFNNIANNNYLVRVVNDTITSNRPNALNTLRAVQTFRNDSDATNPAITNEVGGAHPAVADSASVTTVNNSLPTNAQSVTNINVNGNNINNVDFGFNFDTIVNTNDSGQGSLRQFILNSNQLSNTYLAQALPPAITAPKDKNGNSVTLTNYETSIFMIPNPGNDSRVTLGTGTGQINLSSTPPDGGTNAFVIDISTGGTLSVTDPFTSVDGRTQSVNIPSVSNPPNLTIGSNETTGAEIILTVNGATTLIKGQASNTIFHSLGMINASNSSAIGFVVSNNGGIAVQSADTSNVIMDSLTVSIKGDCGIEGVRMVNSVIRNSVLRDSGTNNQCDNIQLRHNSSQSLIENNLILRAFHYGIDIVSTDSTATANDANIIRNNQIVGNGILGTGQQNGGIAVRTGKNNIIENNIIRNNIGDGVNISNTLINSTNNKITRNSIYNNGDLGIDLGAGAAGNGVTLNDNGDLDSSINQLQNFPVITKILSDGSNYRIQGNFNSTANSNFDLEIYSNKVCNPDVNGIAQPFDGEGDDYGEGEKYHRTVTVTTDTSGNGTFSTTVAIADLAGKIITATATSQTNNTSEFSQCFTTSPELVLVKRITAINPGQVDEVRFNTFVDNPSTTKDNELNWPSNKNTYLPGEFNLTGVKPGDEVEYTIYFLSNGSAEARNVQICDAIPDNMTFVSNSYAANFGMALGLNAAALSTTTKNLSNAIGDDEGDFYPPNTNPAVANSCKKHDPNNPNNLIPLTNANNLSGVVLINLNILPPATAAGTPPNSYGFIRFRAKVK